MSHRRDWAIGFAFAAAVAVGCRAGRPFVAMPSEYADYRATRIAPTLEERLGASAAYLKRYPRGTFTADVRQQFDKAEPVFFADARRTIPGLESYLSVLPDGPHALAAAERLAALRKAENAPDLLGLTARETEARLAAAEQGRADARDGLRRWVAYFLDRSVFERSFGESTSELAVAWGETEPKPTCSDAFDVPPPAPDASSPPPAPPEGGATPPQSPPSERCSKVVQHPYAIPDGGALSDRSLLYEVFVTKGPDGVVRSVTLAGPDLFIRLEETVAKAPRSSKRTAHRIAAITTAVDLLVGAFEDAVSTDPACRRPVAAPFVLHLACGGLEIVARAGELPGDDDEIEIRAVAPPPEPPQPALP